MIRMSLRKFVLATSAVFIGGLVAILSITFLQFSSLKKSFIESQTQVSAMHSMLEIKFNAAEIQEFLTDASLVHDADGLKEASEQLEQAQKQIANLKQIYPERLSELEDLSKELETLNSVGVEMYNAYVQKGKAAGDLIMKRQKTGLDAISDQTTKLVGDWSKKVDENLTRAAEQTLLAQDRSFWIIFGLSILVTLSGLIMVLQLFKRIGPTHEIILKLKSHSEDLGKRSGEINGISTNLSSSTATMASALDESAAAIEEISRMLAKTDENSKKLLELAEQSKEKAGFGQETFKTSVDAIAGLRTELINKLETLAGSNQKVLEIEKVISEIAAKTHVIHDIVFQTKLLSFNASVEAARAGESGKGFAVVAEEVGNLAAQSGRAAIEISRMIDESIRKVKSIIDDNANQTSSLIDSAKVGLEQSVTKLERAREALDVVVGSAESVSEQSTEIASATEESSRGIEEVNKAIHMLKDSTHKTLEATEAGNKVSFKLTGEAKELDDVAGTLSSIVTGAEQA